ncbi:MAG: bifunctional GrpB family protein/GNAT family N-acetyltransferase [Chlamydiota bacterium]
MAKEIRKIEVIPYDPAWPKQFELEADQIKKALGDLCIAIHHVGSTSVPGLAAKPKIDIIVVVKNNPMETIKKLEAVGFDYRGEFNIPLHYGFSKRGKISVNLHVYEEQHPEIELNLTFRDYLRNHPEIRDEYTALKQGLLEKESSFKKNDSMFTGYNLGKDAFIRKVLKLAGFQRLRFVRCTHYDEWDTAKKLRQRYFFDKVPITDPYEWTFSHKDHVHFILCRGVEMIGYAHIQLWPESRAAIRIIVVEETERHQGYGKQFLEWIETWLKWSGYHSLHTESSPDALSFYERLGYKAMPFNDPDGYKGDPRDIPMGKVL